MCTYALWHDEVNVQDHLWIALIFLAIWWALFTGRDLYRTLNSSLTKIPIHRFIAFLNALCIFLAIISLVDTALPDWTAAAIFILCLLYGGIMLIIRPAFRGSDGRSYVCDHGHVAPDYCNGAAIY